MVAPVRWAVSTMSRAERSTCWWSSPFSLLRIFCCGTGASFHLVVGSLLDDVGDDARTHGAAALANCEAKTLIHGDRLDELDLHVRVVARHDHLLALRELDRARHVRR